MYSRAQQTPSSTSSSSQPAGTSWSSSLHHVESHQAPSSAHSRVPCGGVSVVFSVPEPSAPTQLTVTEFSAQLTFVTPGKEQTTAALWDFESGSVSYHQAEGAAAPVERCGERQHRLLLKGGSHTAMCFLSVCGDNVLQPATNWNHQVSEVKFGTFSSVRRTAVCSSLEIKDVFMCGRQN